MSRVSSSTVSEVVVVGCGRWGKVLTRALAGLAPRVARLHVVAERNADEAAAWARAEGLDIRVTPILDDVLRDVRIEAAFVAKMAGEHHDVTRRLLEAGKHVFVEKPFVLTAAEARELVDLADRVGRVLVVGHEYMEAPFLRRFAEHVSRDDEAREIEVVWHEPADGLKHGLPKSPDWSSNVVTNLLPHGVSQLFAILGRRPLTLDAVDSDGDRAATVRLRVGATPAVVRLDRAAPAERRAFVVTSASGRRFEIDFTREPGVIRVDGVVVDEPGLELTKPLQHEIDRFFAQLADARPDLPTLARSAIPIVEATAEASAQFDEAQAAMLRQHWLARDGATAPGAAIRALKHRLMRSLLVRRLIASPKDEARLDAFAAHAFTIGHAFSVAPWTTQAEMLRRTGLATHELVALNGAIRGEPWLQRLIVTEGAGRMYWRSILPLVTSGALGATLAKKYRFPLRTGIYPGVSCMFSCTFCGRSLDASYPRGAAGTGNAAFESIFDSIPTDDAGYSLSFSGGLEPLTNPRFGELVMRASQRGIQVPLITNAFMLTSAYVAKHPGIWCLHSLRVSLYGPNEASYRRTTRVNGAFERVKANLVTFLRQRNARGSSLRVGVNFVILHGAIDEVLGVLDLLADVRRAVDGPGVDVLTLREDFSVREPDGLTTPERARLVDVFRMVRERLVTEPELLGLEVDLGYALLTLAEGRVGRSLAMVTHEEMRPKAYPQISSVVDLNGDVFLYREAGFVDRPGADRYKIGTVTRERSFESVLREFIDTGTPIVPRPEDPELLDAYDHVVTLTLNQADADAAVGIPFEEGPVLARASRKDAS